MRKQTGFTLIEALVALVILSATFAAVWGWFGTVATNTPKIERALRLSLLFDEFIQYLALESLQQTREGEFVIDGYHIAWKADIARSSDNEYYRRQPDWIVVLFNVNATVSLNNEVIETFSTQSVRYWRDPNAPSNIFG